MFDRQTGCPPGKIACLQGFEHLWAAGKNSICSTNICRVATQFFPSNSRTFPGLFKEFYTFFLPGLSETGYSVF